MSSKDRYGKFKKKHYVRMIDNVRYYLCRKFGYKTKPFLFETRLDTNSLMLFRHRAGKYAIFYDYEQFKKRFGEESFDVQEAYAAAIMAHEMRHYYQHRQMIAKNPKEKAETIALWLENEWDPKDLEDGCSLTEYCMQPLELDATLFEYVFGAKMFDAALLLVIKDVEHYDALERLYIEYFEETDEDIFNDKIRELLNERKK